MVTSRREYPTISAAVASWSNVDRLVPGSLPFTRARSSAPMETLRCTHPELPGDFAINYPCRIVWPPEQP